MSRPGVCNTFFEPEVGMPLKKILKGEDDQPKAPDLILALWPHALGKTQPKVGDFKTLILREAPQKNPCSNGHIHGLIHCGNCESFQIRMIPSTRLQISGTNQSFCVAVLINCPRPK